MRRKALVLILGASLIVLGLYSLYWAYMYQQSLNRNLAMLAKTQFPIKEMYETIDQLRRLIPTYSVMGFVLVVYGVVISLLPKLRVVAVVLLMSLVAATPSGYALSGFYSSLVYYEGGWQPWTSINPVADAPYRVQMGSTDKFYTLGGLTHPITAEARSGGHLTYKDSDV